MPLKINLILTQQEAEAIKAKDPMKFVIMGTGAIILLVAAWTGWVYLQYSAVASQNSQVKGKWDAVDKKYKTLLEQEKVQNALQSKAGSLDDAVNKKVIIANLLDEFRGYIKPEMKLTSLSLSRSGADEIVVSFSSFWVGESATENVGHYYNELQSDKIKIKGYSMVPGSLRPLVLNNTDSATKVSFRIEFRMKVKREATP